jgi:hypothetical protein
MTTHHLLQRRCAACDRKAATAPSTRLAVSTPGDRWEREADRAADEVLAGRARPTLTTVATPPLQREGHGAASMSSSHANADAAVHTTLGSAGAPLDGATRSFMETRFHHDFSPVRIHSDAAAAASARAVGAHAYTVGQHIVFGAGQGATGSPAGQRLLAHELAHTVQQRQGGTPWLARQCDPAWAALPWSQRVTNAKAAPASTGNGCIADMLDEALSGNVTVLDKSNDRANVNQAIAAGLYAESGSLSDTQVNFDANLNRKLRNSGLYGFSTFRTHSATPNEIRIFIFLGRNALNEISPQFTQMAFEHESAHAWDFLRDWAVQGGSPHSATPGEELAIYAEGFSHHFLDMWTLDNTAPGSFQMAESFAPLVGNFAQASTVEQNNAFESIRMFHKVRIQGQPCNEMKFKIWLQSLLNQRGGGGPLATRLNGLPGMGLTAGTAPSTFFSTALACA